MNNEVQHGMNQQQIETLLAKTRIDLTQIINQAGINALQYIGSHPVIIPSEDFDSAESCNQQRLKNKISSVLTNYLKCNYESDEFTQNEFIINADFTKLSDNRIPTQSISIRPIVMKLKRPLSIPFFGPEQEQLLPVYYQVTVNIPLIINSKNAHETEPLHSTDLTVTTVLTTRYLGLQHLISSFNESLRNLGPFWRTMTLLTNVYSMARGYRHYQKGLPQNIVDNNHLELITNLVLLFEEALTFGGINPSLLIDAVKQTKSVFSGENINNISSVNSLTKSDWMVSFSDLKESFAEESSTDEQNSKQQLVNITDIASSILWDQTSIQLEFINENEESKIVTYQIDSSKSLEDTVKEYQDNNWVLKGSFKGESVQNQSTIQNINSIAESMYTASFSTEVNRKGPCSIYEGEHNGFPIDNGSSSWVISNITRMSQQTIPEKGTISPGTIVFEEVYTIEWTRSHHWSNKTSEVIENETVIQWDQIIVTDQKKEQNVTFSIKVIDYAEMNYFPGDILDVFYENISADDSNLETTIPSYISTVYEPHKQELFIQDTGTYYQSKISETVPEWITQHAVNALIEIYHQVSRITVDEKINAMNYPNPTELLTLAFEDMLQQFETNKTKFEQKTSYAKNDVFYCTSDKTIYAIRCWYVSFLHQQLQLLSSDLQTDVDDAINDALETADVDDKAVFDEAMNDNLVSSFQHQLSIPFSTSMKLKRMDAETKGWNESLLLSVDHQPAYISCFQQETIDDKQEYFLGIRNTCLLGPSGLPILPITPTTPWLVTLNTWLIQIRGGYAVFSIRDMNDETVFHPLFCHEPIDFTRKNEVIRANDGTILGWNTRLTFAVDTISCSLVPSWGCMVGDTDGVLSEHHGKEV